MQKLDKNLNPVRSLGQKKFKRNFFCRVFNGVNRKTKVCWKSAMLRCITQTSNGVKILIGIAIVSAIGIGALGINIQSEIGKLTPAATSHQIASIENKATLIINDGTRSPQTFKMKVTEGTTVFDLLQQTAIALDYTEYDIGIFVEAIGDKENGQDGKYWLYYVNDEMPMVSVDKKELKPGDKVEFKFEKSPF